MENRFFLLKRLRKERADLIRFLDGLSLYLAAGYDLAFSWPETLQALRGEFRGESWKTFISASEESLLQTLKRATETYPNPDHRLWFSVLAELYRSGAGLSEAVTAMGRTLRREQERDFEWHCQTLPSRMNLTLILFFLPPTLLLLFAPLLIELMSLLS